MENKENDPNTKYQKTFRKKNKHVRSMFNKLVRWFANNTLPQHLEERFKAELTTKEREVFNHQLDRERYKISKEQKSKH